MTILVFRFGKKAGGTAVAGMLRTQATSHVIRQDGGSKNPRNEFLKNKFENWHKIKIIFKKIFNLK